MSNPARSPPTLQQLVAELTRETQAPQTRAVSRTRKVTAIRRQATTRATGPPGPKGDRGTTGRRGKPGKRGPQGLKGLRGPLDKDALLDLMVTNFDDVHRQLNDLMERIAHLQRQIDGTAIHQER